MKLERATDRMHSNYQAPSIRTIEGDAMFDLLGPAQGYVVGTLPYDPMRPMGTAGGGSPVNLSRP